MYTRAELITLRSKLCTAIEDRIPLQCPDFKLEYDCRFWYLAESDKDYRISRVILDGSIVALINPNRGVISINFHNRYDPLIRFIMEVLEVEVQRFGSKYIGYVSPDPLILNPKDRYPEPKIVRSNQDLLESTMYSNIWGHSTIGSIFINTYNISTESSVFTSTLPTIKPHLEGNNVCAEENINEIEIKINNTRT
jgi:hypothetical protein